MAAFPVVSPGPPQSDGIKRLIAVMQRSSKRKLIDRAAVFVCKVTTGTTLFSAHAFGKAVDFMHTPNSHTSEDIARNVVAQATRPTIANRGRRCKDINFIIGGTRQWIRVSRTRFQESAYGGVPHVSHVHAAEHGSTNVRPPCAG